MPIFLADCCGKEGRMPEANQHLHNSVQRLRGESVATSSPGSQLPAPRTIGPERPSGLNMPHPKRPVVSGESLRFTAAAMGQGAAVKRWYKAQIAASPSPPVPSPRRKPGPSLPCERKSLVSGFRRNDECVEMSRAFAHHPHQLPLSTAARAKARQGQIPPLFSSERRHGMN